MSEVTYGEQELKRWLGVIQDKAQACSRSITDHKLDDAECEAVSIFEMAYDVAPCHREGCTVAWPDPSCAPPTGSERRFTLDVDAVETWLYALQEEGIHCAESIRQRELEDADLTAEWISAQASRALIELGAADEAHSYLAPA